MKKIFLAVIAAAVIFVSAETLFAWGKEGAIPNTDIGYTDLSVSKKGVGVRLTNTSGDYVRVSLKLTFFDTNGNSIGYTVFGLREIPANSSVGYLRQLSERQVETLQGFLQDSFCQNDI